MTSISQEIQLLIDDNKVVLFMKGSKDFPQCGFSAATIQAIKNLNVPFETRDVFSSRDIWDGIQEYSNWPTFPQLYINGQFIGGCDITLELAESGELKRLVDEALATAN